VAGGGHFIEGAQAFRSQIDSWAKLLLLELCDDPQFRNNRRTAQFLRKVDTNTGNDADIPHLDQELCLAHEVSRLDIAGVIEVFRCKKLSVRLAANQIDVSLTASAKGPHPLAQILVRDAASLHQTLPRNLNRKKEPAGSSLGTPSARGRTIQIPLRWPRIRQFERPRHDASPIPRDSLTT
jgi:hypothetical protein